MCRERVVERKITEQLNFFLSLVGYKELRPPDFFGSLLFHLHFQLSTYIAFAHRREPLANNGAHCFWFFKALKIRKVQCFQGRRWL